jgi:hypothetical protein
MTHLHRLASMVRWLFDRESTEKELDDELQAFIELSTADKMRGGVPPAEARRQATLELGGIEQAKERVRTCRHGAWLDEAGRDLRYALRMFARNPGFVLVIVLTLALGIGANTAIFSLIDALMLRWLPVRNPQELVQLKMQLPDGTGPAGQGSSQSFSYAIVRALADQKEIFAGVAGFSGFIFTTGSAESIRTVPGALVTGAYYETLGLNPAAGRLLTRADDERGAALVAVISDGYWERQFLRSPGGTGWTFMREIYLKPLMVLMAVVALVLLIACANVASLMLARASARQREIAVRLAIGAGRGRIVRQLLTESTLLSLIGAAFGILLAWAAGRVLVSAISSGPFPVEFDLTPNGHILAFTGAVAVTTGIVFGLAPVFHLTAAGPSPALKDDARMSGARSRLLSSLVSVQVALSLLLLVGAGLFVRTLRNLQSFDPGFKREGVLIVDVPGRRTALPREVLDGSSSRRVAHERRGGAAPDASAEAAGRSGRGPAAVGADRWRDGAGARDGDACRAFGVLALILACVGLYGLLAYSVARRAKELGIRMALGAQRHRLIAMVLSSAVRLVGIGVVLGLPAAWAVSRWLESMLFGLNPADPATIGGAVLLLTTAGLVAAYLPARRASRADPLLALRHE